MEAFDRFVKVASAGDPGSARLCAALLDSAGISVRLHGEALGPYVMTVGQMAVTEIWVLESAMEDAVEVLTAAEIDHTLVVSDSGDAVAESAVPTRLLALVVAAVFLTAVVVALLRVF